MSFKRVHVWGSSGIFLLQLVACSGQGAGERAQARDSSQQDERVDSDAGSRVDAPVTAGKCKNEDGTLNLPELKWLNKLEKPPVYVPSDPDATVLQHYTVTVKAGEVQMLPPCLPKTPVLAYSGKAKRDGVILPANEYYSPGPTFEMTRGVKASVQWINDIEGDHVLTVSGHPHGIPNAQTQVPYVTHLHGLEVAPDSDGAPEAWYTRTLKGEKKPIATGTAYQGDTYEYPNSQPATALWYHDHTFGMTSLNVYAGLAGMYIIREPNGAEPNGFVPPDEAHEWPLVIQDRSFNDDGTLAYPSGGEINVVNGKVWPDMRVEPTRYRFRVLNGANSHAYNLAFPNDGPEITVIGSDGGYLAAPTSVASLPLAAGERADILVDFSQMAEGTSVILNDTSGVEVVRFTVGESPARLPGLPRPIAKLPTTLNTIPELEPNAPTRTLTLNISDDGTYLLDGQAWNGKISEQPRVGATEDWDIVNLTSEDHPIHLHLVQFRIVWRKELQLTEDMTTSLYKEAWVARNSDKLPLNSATQTVELEEKHLVKGVSKAPAPAEAGWKDTAVVPANTVTRIRIRWAPQDAPASTLPGDNEFEFIPFGGPGYVWHCHMLEHEDNEMMRPLQLVK